ncbi:MAG: AAA family ATPase [Coriobacteriaceae bacterium]|nr:AAA family ATPase [Coriobacteriaceae bacterium]
MHLKSLNLKGFKSFADRSVLGFEPGITAIVGPNGSGKSNISDSVLWVLGERNAKNLRGQAMEDVVFAGSSARKPVGLAEVDLVLDNSDKTLPIEFDEVAITRRMYRSGESEYLINGALARRMDVLDILHDTGLGTGTHSIISQGSLDTILQSRPEDRRALIEEAAGVLKHKQRKLKSERKLEQMDMHLARVKDVVAEVERQLKPLERKAKRAMAYQGLAAELAQITLLLAVDDLRNLQAAWEKAKAQESSFEGGLEAMRARINEAEAQMQALQEQIQERGVNAGDIARKYRRAQSVIERMEATTLLLQEKKRSLVAYEAEMRLALESNHVKQRQAQESHRQASLQLQSTEGERQAAEERVSALEAELAGKAAQRGVLEKALEESDLAERELARSIEATRMAQAENQEVLSHNKASEKLIEGRRREVLAQLEAVKSDAADVEAQVAGQLEQLAATKEQEQQAREAVASAFAAREEAREAIDDLRERQAILQAEIKGLEERERARTGESPALAWVLENQDALGAGAEPLAQLITAPPELEGLIECLLGADLSALFVPDLAHAEALVRSLEEQGEPGEVILLPRDDMRITAGGPSESRDPAAASKAAAASPGAAGAAVPAGAASPGADVPAAPAGAAGDPVPIVSLIDCPEAYRPALHALIGGVYLCAGIDEALAAHRSASAAESFVTADGFLIGGNARIQLGMRSSFGEEEGEEELGVLARHRRLEAARLRYAECSSMLEEMLSQKEQAEQALQRSQSESLLLTQGLAQLQGATVAAQEERKRIQEKLAMLDREYTDLERQLRDARAVLDTAQPQTAELEFDLKGLQERREQEKAKKEELNAQLAPLREESKAMTELLGQARLQKATLIERETYARRMRDSSASEMTTLARERQAAREGLAKKTIAKGRVIPLLACFEELGNTARAWTLALEEQTAEVQSLSSGLHAQTTAARENAQKAHAEFDALNDRLSEARVEKGRLEVQVESAIATIVHDCKTPLETAIALGPLQDRAQTEDAAFRLRRRIANMGTINPDAAVEYEDLKSRYDYMATQLEDMASARRALSRIVRVIDARMKEDFVVTFDAVNKNFKEIFEVLFPGGSAELLLVDPADPENTGVEVTAQPRGKRITKMMLMSGGEKSLTALALLFAVYRIRSTPFYILDEVEAALDDTNLRRLCAYFDSLRKDTQLILITHQRRTMELADVLYGISMQADGVTRVVSQKLDQAQRQVEEEVPARSAEG